MIPIGTHSLYMAVTGIVRHPHDPIVVILAGAGDVASLYIVLIALPAPSDVPCSTTTQN